DAPGAGNLTWLGTATCGIPPETPVLQGSLGVAGSGEKMMFLYLGVFSSAEPELTQGLPSGSNFPIGTTTNCYIVSDNAENTATCCFDITVNEYPNPTTTLACNDHINVSVDQNCEAFIGTDMILEGGPYGCYDDYLVSVEGYGSGFGGVLLGSDAVGQTLVVTVTDPETGNSCW